MAPPPNYGARPQPSGAVPSGVVPTHTHSHDLLIGLADDDHIQYARAGASRVGTISVEANSAINQDVTTDAGPTLDHLHLTTSLGAVGALVPNSYQSRIYVNAAVYIDGGSTTRLGVYAASGIINNNSTNWAWIAHNATDFALRSSSNTFAFKDSGATTNYALIDANGITLSARNIVTDTTTGMKVGTATTQKIGFWNVAPVAQPAHVADASGALADVVAQFNVLLTRLERCGIVAAA